MLQEQKQCVKAVVVDYICGALC